jgi:chorismate mutase
VFPGEQDPGTQEEIVTELARSPFNTAPPVTARRAQRGAEVTVTAEQSSEIPAPDEIEALRVEIDQLDAEILRLVKRRSEVSRRIGAARMAAGGPRIVYNREMAVLARFRELGAEGRELGMLLLRLGRGRLGGR